MHKKSILLYNKQGVEKLMFAKCLAQHDLTFVNNFHSLIEYANIKYDIIIINFDTSIFGFEIEEVIKLYQMKHQTKVILVTSLQKDEVLLNIEYNLLLLKPYEICDIIDAIELNSLE